ncbi:MAG: hypothetical protein ACOY42_06950 [Pseudomonadota bacterium]|jgi:hypothetical protein
MDGEAVIYGCIKDCVTAADALRHLRANQEAIEALPAAETWPLIWREMFGTARGSLLLNGPHTEVVHFGAAYRGIEYEWELWMREFETLLERMYWVSATVHLETELSGTHAFHWESTGDCHRPGDGRLRVRCEWSREL